MITMFVHWRPGAGAHLHPLVNNNFLRGDGNIKRKK